jgi:galactokinase
MFSSSSDRLPPAVDRNFTSHFGCEPRVFRAPGRVNLIGEHTDYNAGLVMPAAISRFTWVGVTRRRDGLLSLRSFDLPGTRAVALSSPMTRANDWTDYVVGVAWALAAAGVALPAVDLAVQSDIPLGAGLSSSAALEVAAAAALVDTAGHAINRLELAQLCQQAENDFVGARCGIMDQFAVVHGRRQHCLRLDCRTLQHVEIPLPPRVTMVVCDTMTRHAHASGGYNQRRRECDEALRLLQARRPDLSSLRDATLADLEGARPALSETLVRRVGHVLSENARVERAARALLSNDMTTVGECMAASHQSLRDDFDVTTPELDLMVALAREQPGVYGARMTGGGFGGSTINLVAADAADRFASEIADAYRTATGVAPEILACEPADGVCMLA